MCSGRRISFCKEGKKRNLCKGKNWVGEAYSSPEAFLRMYRMEYRSFKKLCTIISGKILVNDEMARVRTGKEGVTVEIMLHCLLRWLAGGSYIDIRLSAGISPAYFYTSFYKCKCSGCMWPQMQICLCSSCCTWRSQWHCSIQKDWTLSDDSKSCHQKNWWLAIMHIFALKLY